MNGERQAGGAEPSARPVGPGPASGVRDWLDRLGLGAFGAISGVIVIAMFWGLFAIDGLLVRAASDQRDAAADYLQAITQRTAVTAPSMRK